MLKKQPTQAATVFVPNASEVMNFAVVVPSFLKVCFCVDALIHSETDAPREQLSNDNDPLPKRRKTTPEHFDAQKLSVSRGGRYYMAFAASAPAPTVEVLDALFCEPLLSH